ncbi:MAG: hypothetical protein ACR2OU_05000 [Thermomicrobiales bacterium]
MSSKQVRQARDAEANKERRAAARREREAKRAATATTTTTPTTESAPATPKATTKGQLQATSRQPRPPEQAILANDVAFYALEDRDGRLAIFLMLCVLALLALLIIAVLKAA